MKFNHTLGRILTKLYIKLLLVYTTFSTPLIKFNQTNTPIVLVTTDMDHFFNFVVFCMVQCICILCIFCQCAFFFYRYMYYCILLQSSKCTKSIIHFNLCNMDFEKDSMRSNISITYKQTSTICGLLNFYQKSKKC